MWLKEENSNGMAFFLRTTQFLLVVGLEYLKVARAWILHKKQQEHGFYIFVLYVK